MDKWQIIKNGTSIGVFSTIEEAEEEYVKQECDEIRRVRALAEQDEQSLS